MAAGSRDRREWVQAPGTVPEHTAPLAERLALGRYRARGEVTQRLAALVRALWTRDYTPQLSAEFKNIVSKHSSQFRGNAQHDALEFLLWLLDRMHEDLGAASPAQPGRGPTPVGAPAGWGGGDVMPPEGIQVPLSLGKEGLARV
ncbi:hypothetical protein DUI87_28479 [Hirundo rustica rustica]|uniref:ubiquitinyl hydrolase 1 n=1 Tax=Hirundo rustica rustica TaxID=333673 RepID=A0A3M0J1W2_HIRRU|nr:hypothetical protein DUI87_28479 [Hirundo rustica rustica]